MLNEMNEKISSFRLDVGSDVWNAIEGQIDDQPVKKNLFDMLWWGLSGLSLVVFGFYAALGNNEFKAGVVSELNSLKQESTSKTSSKRENETHVFNDHSLKREENGAFKPIVDSNNISQQEGTDKTLTMLTSDFVERSIPLSERQLIVTKEDKQAMNSRNVAFTSVDSLPKEKKESELEIRNPLTTKNRSRWSMLVYAGPGISYRTLKGDKAKSIVDHRNSHEKMALTYDAGIAGQMRINESSYVRVGLNYSRYAEKYKFQHDMISHTTKNTYSYAQLNVSYGKRVAKFGTTDLSILGGVGTSYLINAQSSWIDPNVLLPVSHSNNQQNQPFEKWIFNYRFSLDYKVPLVNGFEFHVIPCMESVFNSSYKKETMLNQHPFAFTLNVGLLYNF